MPIYEYECLACGKHHELLQKFNDRPFTECPSCGGRMKKLISTTSFVLKGTGWYKTDYASGSAGKPPEGPAAETKKSEDKTAATTQSKPEVTAKA